MPNWCLNCVNVSHENKAMIDRIESAIKDGGKGLFMEFFPTPQKLVETTSPCNDQSVMKANIDEYGYADWYDWNVANWGTKWDVEVNDIDRLTDTEVYLCFDSAWSPPIAFFEKMATLGYKIDALYSEPGMCFAGSWNNENGDDYYEYDFTNENWDDDLPENVKDFLQVEYENYLMWQEEEMASQAAH